MKVIDNFLSDDDWSLLKNTYINDILTGYLPLYFAPFISSEYDGDEILNYYFQHNIYKKHKIFSVQLYDFILEKIVPKLDLKAFIRIKLNAYPNIGILREHNPHIDYDFPHKGALLFLNTCNGFTRIENEKVESIENRIVFFEPNKYHNSSSCTDQKLRLTINFNYL